MNPLLCWLASLFAPTPPADFYLGTWLAEDQDGRIELVRQGPGYVGRFVGFQDVALAHRQGYDVGAVLLSNLRPDGEDLAGQVMDYSTHKQYTATLHATDAIHLVLKVKVMGVTAHSETWTRVASARP